eukprot:3746942-Rhodomonas_salina.1
MGTTILRPLRTVYPLANGNHHFEALENRLPICRPRRGRRPGPTPTVYPSVYDDDDDGPALHQPSTHLSTATTTTARPAPTVYPSV